MYYVLCILNVLLLEYHVKFECAFICPEVLTIVGGPGYYPDQEL